MGKNFHKAKPPQYGMAIHLMPHPLAAKRFVEALARRMEEMGWEVELWIEGIHGLEVFAESIKVPTRVKRYSLRGNPLQLLAGVLNMWRSFRAARPRLIQAHQTRDAFIPLLVGCITGVPIRIYHNHGTPYLGYRGFLRAALQGLEWLNCRLATHVITVSAGMQKALVGDGVTAASKCTVLGAGSACGLNLTAFSMARFSEGKEGAKVSLGLSKDAFLALFVGRATRRKGFNRLLELWAPHMDAKDTLWLAGVTPDEVQAIIPAYSGNIRALGYISDLSPFYAAADVVVLPSEHEGFGYALLEGAAMECCLIASRIPGPDALVKEGENGFLIPLDDDEGLVASLKLLRDNRELCRVLGRNARRSAIRFDRDLILNAYGEYLGQFGRAQSGKHEIAGDAGR